MTSKETVRAIAVSSYGPIPNLQFITVPKPSSPTGHDILVRIRACSINRVDTKVRAGTYDDYPDYYTRVPPPHILGFDASGIVEAAGPDVEGFKEGDDVWYAGSPIRQGSNAEFQSVNSRSVALKPRNLD